MTQRIRLTRNQVALVDDEDFEYLNQWKWCSSVAGYAVRRLAANKKEGKPSGMVAMHRLIMNNPIGLEIDHINHNKADNRKENLRICTRSQNNMNRMPRDGLTSKYKGVSWEKRKKKWASYFQINNKKIFLGYFSSEMDAAKAYNKAVIKHFKRFAKLNEV